MSTSNFLNKKGKLKHTSLTPHTKGDMLHFTFPVLDKFNNLIHATSTRLGGVSKGPYSWLNLSFQVGDDPRSVVRNREIFCRRLGLSLDSIVTGKQVHGSNIKIVCNEDKGKGSYNWEGSFSCTDGLVTNAPGVSLLVLVADCAGIVFFDPMHRIIALSHAGWRGTVKGIIPKTVKIMHDEFNSCPEDLITCVSPSIGPCCYRIGNDVLHQLKTFFDGWQRFVVSRSKNDFFLDLWALAEYQLLKAGLMPANINLAKICTACNTDLFYSYRKKTGVTGRCGVIISIKNEDQMA